MQATTTTVASGPPTRLRRLRSLGDRPPLVLTLIVLCSAALVAAFSSRVTSYEPDELGYTHLAIGIARSLAPFTRHYGGVSRLNQLYPLLIAPLWGLFSNVNAFVLSHIWNSLLMASAAIPTYLLSRQVLRQRWAAYGAACIVAVMPWAVIATAELTEVGAFPACAWALLAMQWCLVRRGVVRDVVALVAIAVACYGRLQLIVLAPILVVAVVVHELGFAWHESRRPGAALRRAAVSTARGHLVLSVISVVALAVGVPALIDGALASSFGFYGDAFSGLAFGSATFSLARTYVAATALGLGGVPVAMAIGCVISVLWRPQERRVHAFASLALVAVLVLLYQVAEISVRFNGAVMQERYVFYIVPLLAVGMFTSVLGVRRPAFGIVAGSIIVAVIVATTSYDTSRTPFWYQTSPGLTSFYGWIAPAFGASGSPTSDAAVAALVPAGIAVGLLGVVVAAAVALGPGRRFVRRVLAGLSVLTIAFCCTLLVHGLVSVVVGNSSGGGLGGGNLRRASWVDDALPGRVATVAQLIDNEGGQQTSAQLYNDNAFWNRAVGDSYGQQGFDWPVYLGIGRLTVDRSSGALQFDGPAPSDVVVATHGALMWPAGTVLSTSPDRSLALVRLARPLRARDLVTGVSSGGWLAADHPGTLRVWSTAPGTACVTAKLSFALPVVVDGAERLKVGTHSPIVIRPGQAPTVVARLCPTASRPAVLSFAAVISAGDPGQIPPQLTGVQVR